MTIRLFFLPASVRHLEHETYAKLRNVAETGPGRPGGAAYDPEDPWHALIVDPHSNGCWVHTGIVGADIPEGLPDSLVMLLRIGHDLDAVWVLFDGDLEPALDLPVFDHPDGQLH